MGRTDTHITETESRQIFASALTRFSNKTVRKGDLLFREISERDYGIDGEVELFNHSEATGKFAKIQLKSTEKVIQKLKTVDAVSCSGISKSNLSYCRQRNVPVILIYCSTADEKFYFIDLQSVYKNKIPEIGDNSSGTVRIPIENNSDNLERFVNIINGYYEGTGKESILNRRIVEEVNEWDPFEVVSKYDFVYHQTPSDGEHRQISDSGEVMGEGLWKDGVLICGTEYNWLIKVTKGRLIFKPDCPEDPYDATEDFKYEKMEQYGWEFLFPFSWSEPEIEYKGLSPFYVVDMEVTEKTEQMFNIRTLGNFLKEKNPKRLKHLNKMIAIEVEDNE